MKAEYTAWLLAAAMAGAFCPANTAAKTILDIPVASITNKAYLTSMETRVWWNAAWKKRAAILVSNVADVRAPKAMIDFVFDAGEKVNPTEVRVVTPWETVVPCDVEAKNGGKVEIVFETELRERENRPFFVYWDNPAAPAEKPISPISLAADKKEIKINNGVLEVVFDNQHQTPGLIRTLRVNGSPAATELLWRTSKYAWRGFEFTAGRGEQEWSEGRVVSDTALKKTVRFSGKFAELDFTLYAGQPRVDYAYQLKPGVNNAKIGVAWACGGGCAYDDFYYIGLRGDLLTMRASLDHVTDCMPNPEFYSFPWISRGWYAIRDRHSHDVVGMIFDRDAFGGMWYLGAGQHSGQYTPINFNHRAKQGETASGAGALVATIGDVRDLEREYVFLKNRPKVFIAAVQPYREIPLKIPRLDHDFCINCNVGGWLSSKPLPGDDWAPNIIEHIRKLGANVILLGQLTDYGFTELPVPKELYDKCVQYLKDNGNKRKLPEWKEGESFTGERLKRICSVAHANGLAVQTWHGSVPGIVDWGNPYDEKHWELCREVQALYPQCGVDCVYNGLGGGESPALPQELVKAKGHHFWKWDDPKLSCDARKKVAGHMKDFYDDSKKRNPGLPVLVFNSDNTEIGREMSAPYYIGAIDTLYCEFVAHMNFSKVKHCAKRLRAFFDNEEARTVFAHYYFMEKDYGQRISQTELPFICGVNGFSQESMTYENFDRDFFEITADFNRFALYTRIGEKAAKMGPVKNLAVLRDMKCFEEDLFKHRTLPCEWYEIARHDARGKAFAEMRNYNYDVVLSPLFKRDSLARYNVVYVPDDEVFSDELGVELVAFVKGGGGAVVEGATAGSCKTLKDLALEDGKVKELGKGKILWSKEVLTDTLMKGDGKMIGKVRETLASVGSKNPYDIESKTLDSVLQASSDGMFLGVHNRGKAVDKGVVTLNVLSPSTKNPLFVLDVKNGVRFPFTGLFEIEIGPQQCGFYLIGNDKFTAIPAVTEAEWAGPAATSAFANGQKVQENPNPDFRPLTAVEFVSVSDANHMSSPSYIRRSHEAMLTRKRFCMKEDKLFDHLRTDDLTDWRTRNPDIKPYEVKSFSKALAKASYVHFSTATEDFDQVFVDCADALKDLLKRGGGILFDRKEPGPNAKKFLAEVAVFNPYDSAARGIGDATVKWDASFPTNHPFTTLCHKNVHQDSGSYSRAFGKWDASKQLAPFRLGRDASYATLVIQDNVLSAGKVAFNENSRSFNDWYESKRYGDNLLSYLMGMSVKEHAEKTRYYVGGIGEPVK